MARSIIKEIELLRHSPYSEMPAHSVYLSDADEALLADELRAPVGVRLETVLGLAIERAIKFKSPTVVAGFPRGNE